MLVRSRKLRRYKNDNQGRRRQSILRTSFASSTPDTSTSGLYIHYRNIHTPGVFFENELNSIGTKFGTELLAGGAGLPGRKRDHMAVNPRNVLGVGFGSSPGLCRGSFIYSRPERFYESLRWLVHRRDSVRPRPQPPQRDPLLMAQKQDIRQAEGVLKLMPDPG